MRKLSNRVISCLLCLICMLLLSPVQVFAAGAIDMNKDVHIKIQYIYDKTPVSDVSFDLYYVASVDVYGEFTLAGDFQKYPVVVNGLSTDVWRTLAETLAVYADRDQLKPLDSGKTNAEGNLSFPNKQPRLKPGLYLAVGRKLVKSGYTYTTEPFLVALPNLDRENNAWVYDITATPKRTQTENPPAPPEQTVERRVLKIWKDDIPQSRPKGIVIQLLKDGVIYDTVTLNAGNNWRYTWEKLPAYNKDGSKIVWSVVEKEPEGYTVLIARDDVTFIVTNTYSPDKPTDDTMTRTVLKMWDDKGYESRRPKSVKVTLLQNGTAYDAQVLSESNGWQYTWDKLPKYDKNGIEINWTIREDAVSDYVSSTRQNGFTFVLTNTLDKQKLPQTGLLWWPVPILAVAGFACLITGTFSKKKKDDE